MNETKFTFERYEKKYLLSPEKYAAIRQELDEYIQPDLFFESTVCSLYYDTEDFTLIRRSTEEPLYKEKLRIRSYNVPQPDGPVFVELKKKFNGIVYKRRVMMSATQAEDYLSGRITAPEPCQMTRELDWLLKTYRPEPKAYIACDRQAYAAKNDPELRITFDANLRWRDSELSLVAGSRGEPLVGDGGVLMEIKIPGAAPLWLAHILSSLEVFPIGFSKYGRCYREHILEKYINGVIVCA